MRRLNRLLGWTVLLGVVVLLGGRADAYEPDPTTGYWIVEADGSIEAFGAAQLFGQPVAPGRVTSIEPTPSGLGYWTVKGGTVEAFGDAQVHGQLTDAATITSTASGLGYWLSNPEGCVAAFGDAVFHGDMCGTPLNAPIVDSEITPTEDGYWLLGRDGGVFSFGDAEFHGSTGGLRLNAPVNGMAATTDGYWLVADDGGIFAFGAAPFLGSMGGGPINEPVVGMVPSANGYTMVARDGGIFSFNGPFFGSGVDRGMSDVAAVALTTAEVPDDPSVPWEVLFGETGPDDSVTISDGMIVRVDKDVTVGSVTIEEGGELRGAPNESFTFQIAHRFVNHGTHTSSPDCGYEHVWLNTYTGPWAHRNDGPVRMNEPGFYHAAETYTVNYDGECSRDPWGEIYGGLPAGATEATVSEVDTSTWQIGDEIVIHQSQPLYFDSRSRLKHTNDEHVQTVTITAINGTTVTFDPPLVHARPDPYGEGVEVHNQEQPTVFSGTKVEIPYVLQTGNGRWRIGPPGSSVTDFDTRAEAEAAATAAGRFTEDPDAGRSHVMIMRMADGVDPDGPWYAGPDRNPQTWRGVRFTKMGAMEENRDNGDRSDAHDGPALGRYPIHFHRLGDLTRGTLIEWVSVDDSRNHAVVVHASHGVTVHRVAAFRIFEDAYWWDPDGGDRVGDGRRCSDGFGSGCDSGTAGITYDTVLAGHVRHQRPGDWVRLTGFHLSQGAGNASEPQRPEDINTIRDSVAVDVRGGNSQSSGFEWPENANGGPGWNTWVVENLEAHNVPTAFFVWQNTTRPHREISELSAWHAQVGWFHGAYGNGYLVRDLDVRGSSTCVEVHAIAGTAATETASVLFDGGTCTGDTPDGITSQAFRDANHRLPINVRLRLLDSGEEYEPGNAWARAGTDPDYVRWMPVEVNDWTVRDVDFLWHLGATGHPGYYRHHGLDTDTLAVHATENATDRGFCYWGFVGDDPRPTNWCPFGRPTDTEIEALYSGHSRYGQIGPDGRSQFLQPPLNIDVPVGTQAELIAPVVNGTVQPDVWLNKDSG